MAADGSRNPFRSAHFPRWWLASMVAGTGVGIQAVTVPLFIRDRAAEGNRAVAIAAALVAQTLPGALLALVGGAVADRVERRRILARTYSVAAAVSTVYVVLAGFDVQRIWPVFPLAVVVGSAGAFTNPARQSLLPLLVTRSQLQNAVILGNMGFMATLQFLGPTVAGFVVDLHGLAAAFSLEVVLLAVGAALFARVRTPQPAPSGRSIVEDLRAGLRYVSADPSLRSLLALGTLVGVFFIGPFAVTIPLVVPEVFGASDRWVGILWGCFGGGVFAGSLALTLRPVPRRGLAVILANVSGGVMLWLYGQTDRLEVAVVLLFVWGLGAAVFMNFVVALLQERAEPAMMGRVMSMYSLAFFASTPVGYAQAGFVTDTFGTRTTLLSSGAIATVIGVCALLGLRSVRALR